MSQITTQLKINLPLPLYDYLQSKAQRYGLTMAGYLKTLIVNDIKDMEMPIYCASTKIEKLYRQAKLAETKNQLIDIKDIDQFFQKL